MRKVAGYISNETAVARARMFPFQYFTAYDVLTDLRELKEGKERRKRPGVKDEKPEKERWMVAKEAKQAALAKSLNLSHLSQLKRALDTAVNLAARSNVPPLPVTNLTHLYILSSPAGHHPGPLCLWKRPDRKIQSGKGSLSKGCHGQGHYPHAGPHGSPGILLLS